MIEHTARFSPALLLVAVTAACSGSSASRADLADAPSADPDAAATDPTAERCGSPGAPACSPEPGDAGTDVDASSDGSPGDGGACDPTVRGSCGAAAYCASTDCKSGHCVARPSESSTGEVPVCGCDGITYWNENIANARGMSAGAAGACAKGVSCGGPGPDVPCPDGFSCNKPIAGSGVCNMQSWPGTCWALPKTCASAGIGIDPNTRACNAKSCATRCALIAAEAPYYVDNTCPQ